MSVKIPGLMTPISDTNGKSQPWRPNEIRLGQPSTGDSLPPMPGTSFGISIHRFHTDTVLGGLMSHWRTKPLLAACLSLLFVLAIACSSSEQAPSAGSSSQSIANPPSGSITARDALQHVGSRKTVCGKVESPTYASSSRGQPTFLNLDKPYPNQLFTVVIWGRDRSNFPNAPEEMYRNQRICATGLIETYRGVPQIEAATSSEVRIVDD